jgi:GH35 family endo-1,4-beta-xylanase
MRHINIFSALAISVASIFTSCDDNKMEWYTDPTHGSIQPSELPLGLKEAISRYQPIKSYIPRSNFVMGCGIGLTEYVDDATVNNLVNQNFNDITIGYLMKHGPVMKSDGTLNFTNIDRLFAKTEAAGISVYGHTLVWHQNQNASYLNGLIAPQVIPDAGGTNALNLSGLKDGSFSGWSRNNPGAGITIEDDKGLSTGAKALVMKSSETSNSAWKLQLQTPDITVVSDHTYEVSFFIKSDKPGKGRISFSGLKNSYPWKRWFADSQSATEAFETTSAWKQVIFTINENDDDFTGQSFRMNFDLGYLPDVTYYIDVETIKVIDKDAAPAVINIIKNGDFESGNLSGWSGWGNGSTRSISAEGEGFGDKGYAMVLTNPTAANSYSAQQVYTFDAPLEQGAEYNLSFMVKATTAAALQVQIQDPSYNGDYYGGISVGTTWAQVTKVITPSKNNRNKFIFDFGATACTFYIDNIVLSKATTGPNPVSKVTIIEKTDEEKAEIIGNAMKLWISGMVSHCKNNVTAWDVVNEPMRESGQLRDGSESSGDDIFSWVKYMGKDYAVTAFKLARQYGNGSTDKLFINEYNLEYSEAKLAGLIDYINYIESQGAVVDGIGTQMHLSLKGKNDDAIAAYKAQIDKMFQTMAATGKLIKVSELDIALGTSSPTETQYAQQAEIYRYVVESYLKNIPVNQQYGITVWGLVDSADNANWLPGEKQALWDINYNRKHAYKGFCDGLAGKDVSKDFSGDLQY